MPQLRSDVARNRRSLVGAAIESFRELGWDVPLDTVARRAGVGNATLYRHFPTRNDLYEAAFAEVRERLVAVLHRYRDVDDGWQALHAVIVDIFSAVPVGPAMGSVAQEWLDCSPSLRSVVDEIRDTLDRVLRVAQRQGAVRPDVDVEDLGLLLDAMRPVVVVSDKVAPQFWRRHLVLLLDALRAPAATPLPPPLDDVEQRMRLTDAVKHC
ncbi:MAG TPA: TetR/AcrR family transcriptional regulator [Pseudonocardia sp.]